MRIDRRESIRRLSALYAAGIVGTGWSSLTSGQDASGGASLSPTSSTPPIPAGGQPTGTKLWDGASGVCSGYYNWGAKLPWRHNGGDWIDAANVAQGATAYATLTWNAAGWATANVAALVKLWYAELNTGLYLKCLGNAAIVATRTHSDASLHPVILATLSDGSTLKLTCTASGVANTSASLPVFGPTLSVQNFSSMVLQFQLPALGGRTIVTAMLNLYATRLYGATTCKVFELDPPHIFEGGTAVPGLAARYQGDRGIGNDPQVYFATQFSEPNWQKDHFPLGQLASDAVVVADAKLGTPALRMTYHKGEFSPCTLDHMWTNRVPGAPRTNPAGTLKTYQHIHPNDYDRLNNQDCPSEVYFRYYLKLAADYQCSVDGKKLPGLSGRYGYWNWSGKDSGYYQNVNGNGGSPTKGTKIPEARFPGGYYYSGWSMRHHAGVGPADANPYASYVVATTYAYHAAMTGYFGDAWRWGSPETGWINYEPERWYCIEQYVKMNSLSGPFDALGNGIGNADGIIRGWIDGVLVFEKTDVVFRKHAAIRVDEIWLNHYHGGGLPPEGPHGFEMANLVVANAYIGPMTTGPVVVAPPPPVPKVPGPAWLAGKPLNQWIAIAGTEMANATLAAQIAAGLTDAHGRNLGYGDPRRGILAYSGGALKKSGSEMLVFGGGAGGAWAGNDVRGLRLEDGAPAWQTRVNPSPASKVRPRISARSPYMLDGISPNARHSYWGPQFNDATDTFLTFGCVHTWNSGQFLTVDGASLATGKWKTPGSYPNVPLMRGWDGNWACKHPVTEDVYVAGAIGVSRWQAALNRWSIFWLGTRTDCDRGTAAIDPTGGGTLLRVGAGGATLAFDLSTGVATEGRLTGSFASAIRIGDYYAAGMVFDLGLGKFVLFQDDGHLYTISKVSASSWAVERMNLTGVAPQSLHSSSGYMPAIWGRMQYVPNLKGICIIQAYDRPAYFVKTA